MTATLARALALAIIAAGILAVAVSAAGKPLTWKPASQALLRIDERAVKDWELYQADKKGDRLLLRLGARFLLVDVPQKQIFELADSTVARKGADLLWDPADRPSMPLATSAWTLKDVGLAYRINARLDAEGRVLDLQIPHPIDIRSIH